MKVYATHTVIIPQRIETVQKFVEYRCDYCKQVIDTKLEHDCEHHQTTYSHYVSRGHCEGRNAGPDDGFNFHAHLACAKEVMAGLNHYVRKSEPGECMICGKKNNWKTNQSMRVMARWHESRVWSDLLCCQDCYWQILTPYFKEKLGVCGVKR